MAEQGTLNFVGGDPAVILAALRECGCTVDVVGSSNNWRQISVVCGEAVLTLRLKLQHKDPAYFRRHQPLLLGSIHEIPGGDPQRKAALIQAAGAIRGSIGLTADPRFDANEQLVDILKLAASSVDGFFAFEGGFYDANLRPLLTSDGKSDPGAQLPSLLAVVPADDVFLTDDSVSPRPQRVAERMFIMLAVGYRALLESSPPADAAAKVRELGEWFWSLQVAEELEPHERAGLDSEPGRMRRGLVERLLLSFESIVVLAWALRLAELPAHDEPVDPKQLCETVGLFSEDARYVIDSADLRSPHELREAADRILAVHWRLNQFERDNAPLNMAGMAKEAWFGEIDSGKLSLIDNDLAIANRPVAEIEDDTREQCRVITIERHRAINWLLGHHPTFSKVETAT